MTSPIAGITSAMSGVSGLSALSGIAGTAATPGTTSTSGADFASILAGSVDQLQGMHSTTDALATQAATGDLNDVTDYMIASNEAKLATDTVVTLKNQAVSAFTEIMRMNI
ncbi:flagellar hook-basal body complex protein FliE [Modestobacter altitudinis]|uniref:flagellar hook-basal body complex protein FliE n=1 Tax=Modestobacter altitudinis TaxID=2213158 RepID=UPI00110CDBBD|nr:flagellar hook-basal body complex protein FliE [Modestobacter altitudinis]